MSALLVLLAGAVLVPALLLDADRLRSRWFGS